MRFKVFVYGSLKRDFPLHHHLTGARYLGEAKLPGFRMYDLGWYPGIVPGEGTIFGELYEVDFTTLLLLDQIEDEGEEYRRELLEVFTQEGEKVPAFVYVYRGRVEDKREIVGGRWEKKGPF